MKTNIQNQEEELQYGKSFSGAGNNKYGLVSKEKCDSIKYHRPVYKVNVIITASYQD